MRLHCGFRGTITSTPLTDMLSRQGLSPLSGAGFGGAAGLGGAAGFGGMAALGGMQVYKSLNPSFNSPSDSSSRGGMMAGGIGA